MEYALSFSRRIITVNVPPLTEHQQQSALVAINPNHPVDVEVNAKYELAEEEEAGAAASKFLHIVDRR